LDWDYHTKNDDLSMPGYIKAVLRKFQHPTPTRPENAPHTYGTPLFIAPKHNALRLNKTALFFLKRMPYELKS
jgi:hypothetical protein